MKILTFILLLILCFGNNPICNAQDLTFKDSRDQHEYKFVKIGTQTWMAENLAWLPAVSLSEDGSLTSPFYYVYDYEGNNVSDARATSNYSTYGVLYNWKAAKTACPSGWHLPTHAEWMTLAICLGMSEAEPYTEDSYSRTGAVGSKLKESGTTFWREPNEGTNNSSGFTALPGGYRNWNWGFGDLANTAHFWTASVFNEGNASILILDYRVEGVCRGHAAFQYGYSVRCLKN